MTQRLTLALIAIALSLLLAAMPVLAGPDLSGNEEAVLPGVVTVVAAGDPGHTLGTGIELSGTNTATDLTYLFITGPNLAGQGSCIHNPDPRQCAVENNNPVSFRQVGVRSDHTWSWKWDTANYALADGIYTIYAVARPHDKDHLAATPYGTTSIIITRPLVPITTLQSPVSEPTAPGTKNPAAPLAAPTRSPGYGALIALTGLGAVAFIALRRHRTTL